MKGLTIAKTIYNLENYELSTLPERTLKRLECLGIIEWLPERFFHIDDPEYWTEAENVTTKEKKGELVGIINQYGCICLGISSKSFPRRAYEFKWDNLEWACEDAGYVVTEKGKKLIRKVAEALGHHQLQSIADGA